MIEKRIKLVNTSQIDKSPKKPHKVRVRTNDDASKSLMASKPDAHKQTVQCTQTRRNTPKDKERSAREEGSLQRVQPECSWRDESGSRVPSDGGWGSGVVSVASSLTFASLQSPTRRRAPTVKEAQPAGQRRAGARQAGWWRPRPHPILCPDGGWLQGGL